jgi:hypothetical protein
MKPLSKIWPASPSALSKKLLCTAFVAAPFDPENAIRFHQLHAVAAMRTISRHLRAGFKLDSVEKPDRGCRTDLVFTKPDVGIRLVEIKSSNTIREIHKLQAALYENERFDQIVVSNKHEDIILSPEYVMEVRARAHRVREFLAQHPDKAAITYTPHADICKFCINESCPFLGAKQEEEDPPPNLPSFYDFDESSNFGQD